MLGRVREPFARYRPTLRRRIHPITLIVGLRNFNPRPSPVAAGGLQTGSCSKSRWLAGVYLDALHTYDALLRDLDGWWERVRRGGLLAGDDYGDVLDTEYLSDERYTAKFGTLHKWSENKWGVISAVRDFARRKGVPVQVTWLLDCYTHPAWWMVKP